MDDESSTDNWLSTYNSDIDELNNEASVAASNSDLRIEAELLADDWSSQYSTGMSVDTSWSTDASSSVYTTEKAAPINGDIPWAELGTSVLPLVTIVLFAATVQSPSEFYFVDCYGDNAIVRKRFEIRNRDYEAEVEADNDSLVYRIGKAEDRAGEAAVVAWQMGGAQIVDVDEIEHSQTFCRVEEWVPAVFEDVWRSN